MPIRSRGYYAHTALPIVFRRTRTIVQAAYFFGVARCDGQEKSNRARTGKTPPTFVRKIKEKSHGLFIRASLLIDYDEMQE